MEIVNVADKCSGNVQEVTIGATSDEGGTRGKTVTVGGANSIPFMDIDGSIGHKPAIAMDVYDAPPDEWPEPLLKHYADVVDNPANWAKKCAEFGADLICLKLDAIHPDKGNKSAEETVSTVKSILEAVDIPLIIWGCENDERDNEIMPKVSEAAKGERCLLGGATQENYKTITAVCLADGHNLITQAPVDINIGKQINILVTDLGFPTDRIVMFQTTGALGYGIEYCYSIHERGRIAALSGDHQMATPVICDVGHEAWRAKEAKATDSEAPQWGAFAERGIMWEAITATTLIQSGVDIIRMNHPEAVTIVKKHIENLT
ncbi:small subunit of corrinoid FeS protein of the CODH/ACS complex AcsD [Candidatus Scalindua japonica]|uniref:Small subunit of corrinoid FeS protein of the CODH/ACS complex AcsD n=1 Tax=Candidatus Scalindua japonica TaxID=1284222 RepID=A0A286TV38_9BACT|nr:acetyl-CoA decarbonylase/synthase complex subunit delta [Candidatus Scalindua japonica]GAX59752.1 small subunit of corrinoid FeS protein of the CODH/ACS complex AcsD [Candidatus Scalindua japonica]